MSAKTADEQGAKIAELERERAELLQTISDSVPAESVARIDAARAEANDPFRIKATQLAIGNIVKLRFSATKKVEDIEKQIEARKVVLAETVVKEREEATNEVRARFDELDEREVALYDRLGEWLRDGLERWGDLCDFLYARTYAPAEFDIRDGEVAAEVTRRAQAFVKPQPMDFLALVEMLYTASCDPRAWAAQEGFVIQHPDAESLNARRVPPEDPAWLPKMTPVGDRMPLSFDKHVAVNLPAPDFRELDRFAPTPGDGAPRYASNVNVMRVREADPAAVSPGRPIPEWRN